MIYIEALTKQHYSAINAIQLDQQQNKFSANGEQFLAAIDLDSDGYVIKSDNLLIGYFKIDKQYAEKYDFCPPESLGIRSFTIDPKHQGLGFGKQAVKALLSYVAKHYEQHNFIYLTVNCKNPSAQRCYLKAGFTDTETLYHGGSAGPQHIMYAQLSNL